MKNKKNILFIVLVLAFATTNAQYQKGQWGFGGEFSFINSRNSISRSTTDFADESSNVFNTSIIGGKFISKHTYLYGIADLRYTSNNKDVVIDNFTNSTERQSFSSFFTVQAGIGVRRYFKVNEKNIIGFFAQGQIMLGNTWASELNFSSVNDTVLSNVRRRYPVRLFSVDINTGIYVNITPKWQLMVNVGNLYFTQSAIPHFVNIEAPKRNASFGLDINLFDFRLGILYTPKRK